MTVRRRLVASSALMLFLELALIRWTGSNILHLSYFTNFVLLGSFLGIGLGFLRARADRRPPYYAPIALALLVGLITFFPVTVDRASSEVIYFTSLSTTGPPLWVTLPSTCAAASSASPRSRRWPSWGHHPWSGGCWWPLPSSSSPRRGRPSRSPPRVSPW